MKAALASILTCLGITSCSLVTVPVKTAGSIVTTTVKTTGDIVTAPFGARDRSDSPEESENGKKKPRSNPEEVRRAQTRYYDEPEALSQPSEGRFYPQVQR